MNSLFGVFRAFAAAIVVAAFASPVGAAPPGGGGGNNPAKIYSINVSAFGISPVEVTIKNETPNGNSTINSFIIKPPANVSVTVANPASSLVPSSVTRDPSTGWIYVNGYDGLKAGSQTPKSNTIYLIATYNPPPVCGATYTWTAQAFTGNSWGMEEFAPTVGIPATNQGVQTATCSLRYVPATSTDPLRAPQDALVNQLITSTDNNAPPSNLPVQVEAIDGSGARVTTFSGTVTLMKTAGPTTGTVTGSSAVASSGLATFPNLKIDTEGTYQLKATASGQTDSAPSAPFTIGEGVLDCGGNLNLMFTNPNNLPEFDPSTGLPVPGWAGAGKRGLFNKDGSLCKLVNYSFDNSILTNNSVQLSWAINTQPGAAFTYSVNWKPEYVGATGVPTRVTKIQWFDAFGNLVPASPVAARACVGPDLPAPYGTLSGNINDVATSLTLDTTGAVATLPATPFALTIGKERITATLLTGTTATTKTYNVTRGGTNGTTAAAHNSGDYVVSNPLPLGADGKQMQACIAEEGYAVVPPGAPDCPTTGPGAPAVPTSCVVMSTTLHDIGDGFMTRE